MSTSFILAIIVASVVHAVPIDTLSCNGVDSVICNNTSDSVDGIIKSVVSFLFWLIGILSVIMIIFGGIKYTTSAGDSGKLQSAKNTILYSVIGLAVAILALAIVNFVVDKVG